MLYGRLPTIAQRAACSELRPVERQRIASISVELFADRIAPQPRREVAVDLDALMRPARSIELARSARPGPGPISTIASPGPRIDRVDDARDVRAGRAGSSARSACARDAAGVGASLVAARRAREVARPARARRAGCRRRPARARDVERRAVVDRRADERQAERDVDAVAEGRVLERPAGPGRGTSPGPRRNAARSPARTACRRATDRSTAMPRACACARSPAQ